LLKAVTLPARACQFNAGLLDLLVQGSSSTSQQQPGPPPSEEELPAWVRREKERELQAAGKADLPWPLYLVFSVLVSIASVSVLLVGGPCLVAAARQASQHSAAKDMMFHFLA
jgi:hypothetical protein